jgi:tRNA A-37 threonylcarbamoyl transferase component Bud32
VDLGNGAIEMDYIWGVDLRHLLADGAGTIDYLEVSRRFTSILNSPQDPLSAEVAELIGDVAREGVMQRDLTAANFIRGKDTGRLYVVDFNFVHLRPAPGWWTHADRLSSRLGKLGAGKL